MKIKFNSWYRSKYNGNPYFWAFILLPEFQIQGDKDHKYGVYIGWLFWTIDIEINDYR